MNQVFWNSHIEASFDLVWISSLENRSNHRKAAAFAGFFKFRIVKSRNRFWKRYEFIVIRTCSVHRYKIAHREMTHLLRKNLGRLKVVWHTCYIVTNYRIATLTDTRLSNSISVDLQRFTIKLWTPIVRFIKERLIFLFKMPKFVSLVWFKISV